MPMVILTQERDEAERQAVQLASEGIKAIVYPCIATRLIEYGEALPLSKPIAAFEVIAFTSKRGVAGMMELWDRINRDSLVACVGESTARAVSEQLGLQVAITPQRATAEDLAQLLINRLPPASLLHVRGSLGSGVMRELLEQAGWEVDELIVYENVDPHLEPLQLGYDAIAVFASHSAVQRFFKTNPELRNTLTCVAIGPVTAESLRATGVATVHQASRPELLLDTVQSLLKGVPAP